LNIKYSQLLSQEERLKGEVKTLTDENEFYKKKNAEFEAENAKLNKEIAQTI
jgi:cell division protein FtsB